MITHFTKCLLATVLSLGLAACGLKGPLYMPAVEQPQSQSVTPVAAPAPAKTATQAATQVTTPVATSATTSAATQTTTSPATEVAPR
ncbi:MAG: LPS translocon maturation chaperone LptM [Aeromonas sp.]